ncbi:WecB/TagA/CpsF family glycosyltransferase [Cryobacterium psychrophilum]|uniref:Glycosyltransferase n=1 Tax=Cryobacterium psychrophilum TaxID=41988 RepID=A0A4Y8KRH8_9MICO|nr:WecB/TagA/CpsF family glycosyltransferase [Cryobacterium psychrophilum]TDW29782.1 N-acetylglucosaminyldiphosphoundecaprenol N-acetyl-beta-D-mannosaminyltransferase [Cryobacterium psychrophilum]TFD81879.1 glycosyltransferase [Cryobacterium psychrophilum]
MLHAEVKEFHYSTVGHVPFAITNLEQATAWLIATSKGGPTPIAVRLANAYCVALAEGEQSYRTLLTTSGINFPDGTPVVKVMQLNCRGSQAEPGRVRGPSLFTRVLEEGQHQGLRHFFLGGSPETLAALETNVKSRFPDAEIVGSYSPPFAPISDSYVDDCAQTIEQTSAEVVWVGLGTPKQDFVASALAPRLGLPVVGVGAAFDFVAGTTREAPVWMQNSGTEWLFRFASEPRRLWKRYVFGNIRFLKAVIWPRQKH